MKPSIKVLVGVLSHFPFVHMLTFMGFMIYMVTHAAGGGARGTGMPLPMVLLVVSHVLVMLLTFVLIAFWVTWLIKASGLPQETKVIWSLGCFFAGPIVMPLLFWLYLRKIPKGPYVLGAPLSGTDGPMADPSRSLGE